MPKEPAGNAAPPAPKKGWKKIKVGFGSPINIPCGVRTIRTDTEQRPLLGPGLAKPGWGGREGKALEIELLPQGGSVSRKAAIRGHSR